MGGWFPVDVYDQEEEDLCIKGRGVKGSKTYREGMREKKWREDDGGGEGMSLERTEEDFVGWACPDGSIAMQRGSWSCEPGYSGRVGAKVGLLVMLIDAN